MLIPKRVILFLGLLLTTLLIAFSAEAFAAAEAGLALWWNAVLPTLLPFYIGASCLLSGGAFDALSRLSAPLAKRNAMPAALPGVLLIGAVSGYPVGARLAGENGLSDLAPYANLCSPIFMLCVLGGELLGSVRLALPILTAHYASALLTLVLKISLIGLPRAEMRPAAVLASFSLPETIGSGMDAMLRVGGCIVFFSVVSALLEKAGVFAFAAAPAVLLGADRAAVYAVFTGLFEFSCGCRAVALANLPVRSAVSLMAGLTSFGGLSVLMQAKLFAPPLRTPPYLAAKALQGALAAALAYLLFPLFANSAVTAMQIDADLAIKNAVAGGSLLLISAAAMAFIMLLSVVLSRLTPKAEQPKQ